MIFFLNLFHIFDFLLINSNLILFFLSQLPTKNKDIDEIILEKDEYYFRPSLFGIFFT